MSENPGRSRRRTSKTAKTGGDHPSLVYPVYLYQTQSTSERYTLTFATLLVCIAFLLVICKESIAVMVALACRQMTCRRLLRELQPKTIPMLRERQFKLPILNKSFACCWLDMDNVLLGTKCNKLINLNLKTGKHFEIRRPPRPLRTFSTLSDDWGNCGIHSITMNPSGDLIATGGTDPADCDIIRTANWTPVATLVGHRDWLFGAAWVTDRHVVTGSRDGSVALWDVNFACGPDGPAFAPGNGDEAQQITWAPIIEYSYHNPQHMKRKFGGRVRDIKFEPEQRLVAALDTDGVIKVMDPASGLRIVRTLPVNRPYDLIALAVRSDMIAVGGMRHVILVDPRARRSAPSNLFLESPDVTNGVRSVSFSNNILTYGTGHGKIAFYDLRAGKYLPTLCEGQVARCSNVYDTSMEGPSGEGRSHGRAAINVRLPYVEAPKQCLQTGSGWIMQDETFMDMFALFGHTLRHACYAHAWDKSCTRLFTCGGPLECGLTGGYAAIWE